MYLKKVANTTESFQFLNHVQELGISACGKDEDLRHLTSVKKLRIYDCDHVTGSGLKYMSDLVSFHAHTCQIQNSGLQYLTRVTKAAITDCKLIGDNGISYLSGVRYGQRTL
jgi:hypothetical protein